MRVFGTNHPQQPTQPALLEVRPVVGQHLLGVSGQHIQPRCLAHDLGELAGDTHHLFNVLATVDGGLVVGVAVLGCGEYHHAGEPAGAELVAQPRGLGWGRPVGPQPPHTQRQQQTTITHALDGGMSRHRLEARIQQRRVDAVGALLRADRTRHADLGQHRLAGPLGGMRTG